MCVLAVALVACDSTAPVAEPAPSSATTTTTTSSAPSLMDRLPALVERAAIPRDGLSDFGIAAPADQRYAVTGMPKPCNTDVDGEHGYTPGLYRQWKGDIDVRQTVVGYTEATGAEVLSQLTAATRDCSSWTSEDRESRIIPDTIVEQPAGLAGFVGYCTSVRQPHQVYWLCAALMAHGNLVSNVWAFSGRGPEDARDNLAKIVPRAVDRLLNA